MYVFCIPNVFWFAYACAHTHVNFGKPTPCGFCWSRWVLHGELAYKARRSEPFDEFATKVSETLWPNCDPSQQPQVSPGMNAAPVVLPSPDAARDVAFSRLSTLVEWYTHGLLSAEEFQAAKHSLNLG